MHIWLQLERQRVPNGSGIAGAIDYSLNHWAALTANLRNGNVPVDNNHCENQMRPWGSWKKVVVIRAASWQANVRLSS